MAIKQEMYFLVRNKERTRYWTCDVKAAVVDDLESGSTNEYFLIKENGSKVVTKPVTVGPKLEERVKVVPEILVDGSAI